MILATADTEYEWIFQVRYGNAKQNGKVNNGTDYMDLAWLVFEIDAPHIHSMKFHYRNYFRPFKFGH